MSLLSKSASATILLKSLEMNSETHEIEMKGERKGFIRWLLSKLGLTNLTYNLSITQERVIVEDAKNVSFLPTKELHNYSGGYKNNKLLILVSFGSIVGAVFFLIDEMNSYRGFEGESLILVIPLILIAGLVGWFYKKSGVLFIGLNTFNGLGTNVKIKSGSGTLQGGGTVTSESVQEILTHIHELTNSNSKYYSK